MIVLEYKNHITCNALWFVNALTIQQLRVMKPHKAMHSQLND